MPGGAKLSRKEELAIAALLSEPSHDLAAAKVEVDPSTLTRWLQKPEFRNAYRQARAQVLEGVIATLLRHADAACACLAGNLTAPKPGDQIRAAVAVLDHVMRGAELLDLAVRLEAVEQALAQRQDDGVHTNDGSES